MEKLKTRDFLDYKYLSGIEFSPNGENIGFIVHRIDIENNTYLSNIHILNSKTHKEIKLTSLDKESSFIWKDNENILFKSYRDNKDLSRLKSKEKFTVYYNININGGEANKAFEIPFLVKSLKFISDTEVLILTDFNGDQILLEDKSSEEIKQYYEDTANFEVLNEIPFWGNGIGFTNKKRSRLYRYNLETKKSLPISDNFTDVYSFELNEDKTKVLIISSAYMDKMNTKSALYLYDLESDLVHKLSTTGEFNYSSAHFLEDKIIFTCSDSESYGINENPNFYIMDQKGIKKRQIAIDFNSSINSSVGSDIRFGSSSFISIDGKYLYFISTDKYSSYINRVNILGEIEKITTLDGSIDGFTIKNENIYFIGLKENRLQEIYNSKNENLNITNFNIWVAEERYTSTPIYHQFESAENLLDGFVLLPANYSSSENYPGILSIHGGPKTVYGKVFYHEMQVLANEGYLVFFCNPRGSDGRGNEFADIRGKYGTIDYEDLMNFTDYIIKTYPNLNKDNLGVIGGSYGGFMTNWIIGHNTRFKAAVSQRSISNWTSFFGTSDIGYYFTDDQNNATPWSDPKKLWFHSPLKYADKVQTPTLFIHSTEDYRCWLAEGLQMFTALKYHGVDSRLVMFKGENHDLSRSGKPKSRLKRLDEIVTWFNSYLK